MNKNTKSNKKVRQRNFNAHERQKQLQTHNAYRAVIGALFSNMTEAHKQRLDRAVEGFQSAIKLMHSIYTQMIKIDVRGVKAKKPSYDTRWYEDGDIDQLMDHYFGQNPGIVHTTPLQGDGHFARNDLEDTIVEFLQGNMNDDSGTGTKTALIPLNIGAQISPALPENSTPSGQHWTLAIIEFASEVRGPRLYYFDSLYSDTNDSLKNVLQNSVYRVFNQRTILTPLTLKRVQKDGYNCGPWIIEAARYYFTSSLSSSSQSLTGHGLEQTDIAKARREHNRIVGYIPPNRSSRRKKKKRKTSTPSRSSKKPCLQPSESTEQKTPERTTGPSLNRGTSRLFKPMFNPSIISIPDSSNDSKASIFEFPDNA